MLALHVGVGLPILAHREILLQRNLGRYRGQADTQQAAFHSIWLERPTRSAFPWFESCRRQLPRGACNTLETSASGARRTRLTSCRLAPVANEPKGEVD